ncbi:hydroxymethylglutaryl-CoA lyase [Myxococcus stipitatus]|uniref:hydroxymethylglutaryl-CoA lyase n=1 Tax=Myxococcus stipitatus TaxID=83455 RepID=UPI001F39283D|nr:hydroxymethylglutaryl-CoA lyase [Myxococcus stipitatus]MCE9667728.1 hydroxymethylglutaryl-CoA lyase [Myxococcus stipitatus]
MSTVRIVEVGPRDGLQNEAVLLPTRKKVELIDRLADAGLREIEATSFVSPQWVPQMADHSDVMRQLARRPGLRYPVLTPNLRGYRNAVEAGAAHVAVFTSASEAFARKNINSTIDESFVRFAPVFEAARADGIPVRGYVSCAIACPYEGRIAPERVAGVARRLVEAGCYEISLGDTIGVGTPATVKPLLAAVAAQVPLERIAGHFHDTYGMGIANVHAAYEFGVRVFDSSVAGLGGCPYAKGASGNVATEDLVYLLRDMGIDTGVDMDRLVECAVWISQQLGRPLGSRVGRALRCAA